MADAGSPRKSCPILSISSSRISGFVVLALLHPLDDLAGHRADIGAPVATDLGLVAHATQADADELAPRRPRHRPAERGLAHARRADEAQDRALQLFRALLHGKIFDDPFLDLFQPVMIVVEDLLGAAEILLHAALHPPRDRQHPFEIVAHHRGLGRHRRHVAQLLQLGLGPLARLFRQSGGGDPLLQLADLVLAVFGIAQLALDRLHLFVEVVFALGPLHLALDPALDLLLDLQDRQFGLHQRIDRLQPLGHRQRLQQLLLARDLDRKMARHHIGQLARLRGVGHHRQRLFGHVLLELRIALELPGDRAQQRRDGSLVAQTFGQFFGARLEERGIVHEAGNAHPLLAFDQHLDRAVGQFQQLQHRGQNPGAIDVVGPGRVRRRVLLAGQKDLAIVLHHLFERAHRHGAADEERHDHMRKDDDIAQRQNRKRIVGGSGHEISLADGGRHGSRHRQPRHPLCSHQICGPRQAGSSAASPARKTRPRPRGRGLAGRRCLRPGQPAATLATSAAKSPSSFSIPSPTSSRTKPVIVTPAALAASATDRSGSTTNVCFSRVTSS
jgi:hypothetical protein